MTATGAAPSPITQEICIDLPGEAVQCWRSGDKVRVILRKHRDVVFDLKLGNRKVYTVEATESDFYNARDKRLVYAKRKENVKFKDGERLHLWVTRNFRGALLLKCEGKLIMKLEPNEVDKHQYDDDPKTKMAPIIIAMGGGGQPTGSAPPLAAPKTVLGPVRAAAPAPTASQPSIVPSLAPRLAAAPVDEDCAVVCVVDGALKGAPKKVAEHFMNGGQVLEFDPTDVVTSNWLWGQAANSAAYVGDNWKWLRASIETRHHAGFRLVSAKMHVVRGKVRFYFSGFSKYNTIFKQGGFGPGHERIMTIFAGAGQTKSAFTAVAKGVAGSFKSNALVSFIFGSATSYAEWQADTSKDGYDLAAALITTTIKTIVAAALVIAAVALIVLLCFKLLAISLCVLVVGVLTIGLGILANYGVGVADQLLGKAAMGDQKSTAGMAGAIAPMMREAGKKISETWDYLMSKFPNDYKAFQF